MKLCPLHRFNKIFGEPNKGFHSFHILGIAVGDYVVTLLAAFLLSYISGVPVVLTTIFLFILGIILHTLFGIPTSAVKYLGLTC